MWTCDNDHIILFLAAVKTPVTVIIKNETWKKHEYIYKLVVGVFMSYLCFLCLYVHIGVQHILCCVFVLFFFILCALCCQFLWIVPLFWLPLRYSLTFIYHNMILTLSILALYIYNCLDQMRYWSNKQTYTCSLFFLQIFVFLIVVTSLKFPIFF